MSVLTGESRLQHLSVVVHVVLCVIICSCIFHRSSWSCIFWSSILWSSIFRSSIFRLLTSNKAELVLHFPVLHFPPSDFTLNLVLLFPVLHFPPSDFWDYWSCFFRSSNFRSSIFIAHPAHKSIQRRSAI